MIAPSTSPSSGLKTKIMHLGKAAILSTVVLAASAQCTINTTLQVQWHLKQGTVANPIKILFGTDNGYSTEFEIKCKKGGDFTGCDSTKTFCVRYNCSKPAVQVKSMTYLGVSLGSFTRPSASSTSGDYTFDNYYSCY